MSTEPGNIFEKRFHNRLDDLSRVTEEAVRFIEERGVGNRAVYLVNLAIEEMVTNILKYGYDDTAVHEILLRLEVHPGALRLVLEDDGHEFNPMKAPVPDVNRPAEQRALGGLGIHLIRKLVEQMNYERCGGRNRLTISIPS
jgi:anti-sigma regulatory factor (Ser/Thr protein kinase)